MHMRQWFMRLILVAAIPGLFMGVAAWAQMAHSDAGCDGCHVPHNAETLPGVPLWNGSETTVTFTMYSSATFQGTIGRPAQRGLEAVPELSRRRKSGLPVDE